MEERLSTQEKHLGRRLDLTGQRFGKLTALRPSEDIGGRTAWLCRCECGREISARTHHLRSGHVTTCGCIECGGGRDVRARLTMVDGTCVEMLKSKHVRKNNTSGVPGVDWLSKTGRWRASICFKGKRYYLGKYERFEDAVTARREAEEKYHDAFVAQFTQSEN